MWSMTQIINIAAPLRTDGFGADTGNPLA